MEFTTENWCKNSYVDYRGGIRKTCLGVRLNEKYPNDRLAVEVLRVIIDHTYPGHFGVSHFNDDPKVTVEDINKVWDEFVIKYQNHLQRSRK
jgi:hypothetical protein